MHLTVEQIFLSAFRCCASVDWLVYPESRCFTIATKDSLDCLPVGQAFLPLASGIVKGLLSIGSPVTGNRSPAHRLERASQLVKELQLFDPELVERVKEPQVLLTLNLLKGQRTLGLYP